MADPTVRGVLGDVSMRDAIPGADPCRACAMMAAQAEAKEVERLTQV